MAIVLLRGGGDLATGVALRLYRSGVAVVITELPKPLAVRRAVSFCEAVYEGEWAVEGVRACRAGTVGDAAQALARRVIPVLVEPDLLHHPSLDVAAIVDARLTKVPPDGLTAESPLVIGLGPGFTAGRDCHAIIETQRGGTFGRVYWSGSALANTAAPEGDPRRVLRAPTGGTVTAHALIGDTVAAGQVLADVAGVPVAAPFPGVLRGLIRPGLWVPAGTKIGDIDPRGVRDLCFLASDKALGVGGGVLEALLTRPAVRTRLWT
jgi:xanthine dehydrogenase accessory factor